ncbi:unnamed protein product [Anisakis simplex]|uniref:Uncharacterized protein n=1 Tax=Anisakis simplex TaxID=6269 RepID=A0A3P6PA20_ANISI|nr:unnamed protein product [Anisakis simplex]
MNPRCPVRCRSEDAVSVFEETPTETSSYTRKKLKTKSMSSTALKTGPFMTIKENEKKVKKKDSTIDLSSLEHELDDED